MPKFKTDRDILKYAISREITSYDLYNQLAERVHKEEVLKIIEDLADQELKHKQRLELELMKLGQVVPDDDQVIELDDPAVTAAIEGIDPKDIKSILLFALEREHVSVNTFITLAVESKTDSLRKILIALAEEEAKHHGLIKLECDMLEYYQHHPPKE